MHQGPLGDTSRLNADAPWRDFDPKAYVDRNYKKLLEEDREIILIVRSHFSSHFRAHPVPSIKGIDVGAGANLYPAFSMLPWCGEITLFDRAVQNVAYLEGQRENGYDQGWDKFWNLFREDEAYDALSGDSRAQFTEVTRVEEGDLFTLRNRSDRWSIGTMFFVAESVSTSHEQFWRAVECFLRALTPGAPFAAAFMEHSEGYMVGATDFPACYVGESEIRSAVARHAEEVEIFAVGKPHVLRDGYTSMIVACGLRDEGS